MSINQPLWTRISPSSSHRSSSACSCVGTHKVSKGFTLVELVVVISIMAVMATAALDRLFWYQGQAEKTAMEYTATMIKSGLWMEAASLMMAERTSDIPALAKRNPIDLLAQKPENYLGEMHNVKVELLESGNWFYDASTHQVVYMVKHRRYFTPEVIDDYQVRYGMRVLYGEMDIVSGNKASYIAGATLVPLSKYTWN
ncbi:MAG: prepilin-type N-terminal cleavage/methylation domain-containing protein [Methylotenera sp.]|nr:prepilin-type N-terminal cleavage/methylation domain-containing protein [Methylotenera sp.]